MEGLDPREVAKTVRVHVGALEMLVEDLSKTGLGARQAIEVERLGKLLVKLTAEFPMPEYCKHVLDVPFNEWTFCPMCGERIGEE